MKNLIITLCLVATFANAYSQDKPCPTKPETMEWIAAKMKDYLSSPAIFQSYNKGVFKCKYLTPPSGYFTVEIDLNKLIAYSWNESTLDFKGSKIQTPQTYYTNDEKDFDVMSFHRLEAWKSGGKALFEFDLDPGLRARLKKALDCLVQYNNLPVAKEKF